MARLIGEVVLNQIGRLALPVANPRPRTIALPSAVSKQLPRPDTGSAAPVDPTIAELDAFLPAVKPASRDGNKWRGPRGQDETEKSDHFVSLGDSIASSTRTGFLVHTVAACRTWSYNPRLTAATVQEHVIAFEQTHCLGGTSH